MASVDTGASPQSTAPGSAGAAAYDGLAPTELWRHFAALNLIPRPSGAEAAARDYVEQIAEAAGATCETDAKGNIVVRVGARGFSDDVQRVAVQTHLDMVCDANPGVTHDWLHDPIKVVRDGDRIRAEGTTLGADNGIGVAAALALLSTPDVRHGPLELLFTVEEETGLDGALALDPSLLRARCLVNLDSEDPAGLTIGCAGATSVRLGLPERRADVDASWLGREIVVGGLRGGHSGVDIDKRRANAIKLVAEALAAIDATGIEWHLGTLEGGGTHNTIPRQASAAITLEASSEPSFATVMSVIRARFERIWSDDEPALTLTVVDAPPPQSALTRSETDLLIRILESMPHGVQSMSQRFAGAIQTSANLAGVTTTAGEILISIRSISDDDMKRTVSAIADLAAGAGMRAEVDAGYPGWEPDPESELLATTTEVYRDIYGRAPVIGLVHGGLECGVIVAKLPGLEAVSVGPLIVGAHTPEESVEIASVGTTWLLLTRLLEVLGVELRSGAVTLASATLGLVAIVVGVAALFVAIRTDRRVQNSLRSLEDVRRGLSTRWVGEFPRFVGDVNNVLKSATKKITIFCDLPAYAVFSDPAGYETYRNTITAYRGTAGFTVRLLCLKGEARAQLHSRQFTLKTWRPGDPRVAAFYRTHDCAPSTPADPTDPDAKLTQFLTALEGVQAKEEEALDAKPIAAIMPLYFWVADEREAVFAPTAFKAADREVAFRTTDDRLIQSLLAIFEEYAPAGA